ncbi:helix-turn-helix domain-containing protein [Actinomadura monticuli]|uniref:Helix-turn-helix transcriptional regulator n=1 Tax=Actinomadura monticuli TaxID=3097367 RepID=A0ABV4Q5N0_9ACTN
MTDNPRPEWAKRLQAERVARSWSQATMAKQLWAAAGVTPTPTQVKSLARQIRGYENGKRPREWAAPYAQVFGLPEDDLFAVAGPPALDALPMLLRAPSSPTTADLSRLPPIERVEGMLRRLYRLEAEFGGDELCAVVADQVEFAAALFGSSALTADLQQRLHVAMAGLTQIAGWLAIDANRHGDVGRHLSATVYAAHEIGDLGLAAHAMGYMSLHFLYRDEARQALSLAATASTLAAAAGTPKTRAILHDRTARAHARLGQADACLRHLDLADAEYAAPAAAGEPQWLGYVSEVEIAAQRGACLLDLAKAHPAMAHQAVESLQNVVAQVEAAEPDHQRDLAHYRTRLASAHLLQGEPARAAQVAETAYETTLQIGSARVAERFEELMTSFEPYEDVPEVRDMVATVKGR